MGFLSKSVDSSDRKDSLIEMLVLPCYGVVGCANVYTYLCMYMYIYIYVHRYNNHIYNFWCMINDPNLNTIDYGNLICLIKILLGVTTAYIHKYIHIYTYIHT